MVVLVTGITITKANGHQRNKSYIKPLKNGEKKRVRYPDIVLLTFTVGISNAYKLPNRAVFSL